MRSYPVNSTNYELVDTNVNIYNNFFEALHVINYELSILFHIVLSGQYVIFSCTTNNSKVNVGTISSAKNLLRR